MAYLEYKARDEFGRLHQGREESANETLLRGSLRTRGLYLVEAKSSNSATRKRRGRVSRKDIILFAYHLQTVVAGGIPLLTGLEDLAKQTRNRYLRWLIEDLISALNAGSSLSDALERHPSVFPKTFTAIVRAGEESGRLPDVLGRLVSLLEWREELRGQIKQVATYPIILISAMVGLTVLFLTYVIPKFEGLLTSMQVELPLPTRILMGASHLFVANWIWILAMAIGCTIGFVVLKRRPWFVLLLDSLALKVPILGDLKLSLISSQVAHFLGAFTSAGVPVTHGLGLVADIAGNAKIETAIRRVRSRVEEGETMTDAFAEVGVFPALVMRMISIGEETGKLAEALSKAEEYYNREVPRRVKSLVDISGPVISIFMAGFLCVVVLAVLLPIYKMYGAIGGH